MVHGHIEKLFRSLEYGTRKTGENKMHRHNKIEEKMWNSIFN